MDGSVVFARLRQCASPTKACFFGPARAHNPNGISIGSAVFVQLTAGRPHTLQWVTLSPQNCHSYGMIWNPIYTWFLGVTRVLNPNGIWIGWAVFASLTTVTDRQIDRQTTIYVTIGRIYARGTAMRPVNTLAYISHSAPCCHSNETRAPTANPSNSAYHSQVTSGSVQYSVGMRRGTDRQTEGRDQYTFRLGYALHEM